MGRSFLRFRPWAPRLFPELLFLASSRCVPPFAFYAGNLCSWRPGSQHRARDEEGKLVLDPKYNLHSLRHFRASLLIADGANPNEVQAEMGHSTITVTYDLYGHLFKDDAADKLRRDRAERLAEALA